MDNLIIEIGAQTQDFLSGLAEVGDKTSDLGSQLTEIGVVAGAAFAGYTAAIMGCVYAYRQEELVGQEMQATLQATGGIAGVTSSMIEELADSLSKSTTFSKLQVEQGEAMLLTFDEIGKDTFPAATQATLDLAQHMGGDAAGAAKLLGKALQDPMTGTTALTRAGVQLTAQQKAQIQAMELAGNMAGAQAVVIQAVEDRYGHMAQAAAGGTGQITVLKNAMELLAANIGAEFAPAIGAAAGGLADLINWASQNKTVVEFGAAMLGMAAAAAGVVTTVVGGALAFEKLSAVMQGSALVMDALALSTRALVGATGIGLILIAVYELYEHWSTIWPAMQAVYHAFVDNIGTVAQGLYKVLNGALHLDMDQVKAGLAQAAAAWSAGSKTVGDSFQPKVTASAAGLAAAAQAGNDIQSALNRARLVAARAGAQELRSWEAQSLAAEGQLKLDTAQHYSTALLALEKQEVAQLKSLADAKYQGDKKALAVALKETQAQYKAAYAVENTARAKFTGDYLANDKNFQALSKADQASYLASHEAALVGSMQNETAAKEAVITADLQRQIKADDTELQEAVRYGAAYAAINKEMHSTVYQGTQSAFSQLSQLTASGNQTLKAIGTAASVVDIEMKGAQSAMAIYAGFSTLPPWIGIPLGIAGAAAAELFAQEKVVQVLGLSQGGLVTGGIPGVDSVPAMMTPGELAVPTKNFDEVVNSVAANRQGTQAAQPQQVQVQVNIGFQGSASRILTVLTNQDKALGRYRGSS